jgi:tetratricopeptide (TPR) repeat protein
MKFNFLLAYFLFNLLACQITLFSQPFTCGSQLPIPTYSEKQQLLLDSQLHIAKQHVEKAPHNADALIWYARRLGYLARYQQAIDVLTKGIEMHPVDARMYRHRGHRYLTLRCIDQAIADFEKAALLVKGKTDEIEPDGQPNEANTPTSTLQSNIYYHLALAYYLQKNYQKAKKAYEKCMLVSANPDMYTATANWNYLTLRRMGSNREAADLLATVDFETPLLENEVYRKILLLHKEKPSAEKAIATATGAGNVQSATYLYGLYMYLKLNDYSAEAKQVKQQLMDGKQYASFGYIAVEVE